MDIAKGPLSVLKNLDYFTIFFHTGALEAGHSLCNK